MNSLAKDLSGDLDVRCSTMAFAIRPAVDAGSPWQVVIDDGTVHRADVVDRHHTAPPGVRAARRPGRPRRVVDAHGLRPHDRAPLATLDRPPAIPAPGGVQGPTPELSFVADNAAKGVSATPAITVHASAAWSEGALGTTTSKNSSVRCSNSPRPGLGDATVLDAQVKKWRFATPRTPWPDPCWIADGGTVVLAGDAFDGPRVEAAHNSGLAVAHALTA